MTRLEALRAIVAQPDAAIKPPRVLYTGCTAKVQLSASLRTPLRLAVLQLNRAHGPVIRRVA